VGAKLLPRERRSCLVTLAVPRCRYHRSGRPLSPGDLHVFEELPEAPLVLWRDATESTLHLGACFSIY
jgi:hypothetical protein